jgi:DNA-binding XRE family transcriptional regulator
VKNEDRVKAFGIHIRHLREDKGWSQQKLAEESDLAKQTIQRLEWGQYNPTLGVIISISKALDIPLPDLVKF